MERKDYAISLFNKINTPKEATEGQIKLERKDYAPSLFNKIITPKEAAEILNLSEGTVRNKCAANELLCKKAGKQWLLDKDYLEDTMLVEVWRRYNDIDYYVTPDEISHYYIPEVDKERYFEVNKEKLETFYGDDDEASFTIDDVDWNDVEERLNGDAESWVLVEDFTEEYALEYGFKPPVPEDVVWRAWRYLDSNANWCTVWEEDIDYARQYVVSVEYVSLDEWDGHNFTTNGVGRHQVVYRILKEYEQFVDNYYLVVEHSQWSGEQSTILFAGDLKRVLTHIEELGERDVEEYKKSLLEL